MARGNQKQSKSLNISTRDAVNDLQKDEIARLRGELSAHKRTLSPYYTEGQHERILASEAAISKGADWLEQNIDNPDVSRKVKAFVTLLAEYTSDNYAAADGKGRKSKMAEAWAALPKELKEAWSVPITDMKYLMRGGNHANNPGPDGLAVSSFTPKFNTAEYFKNNDEHSRARYSGSIYTPDDIESHGDIIYAPAITKTVWKIYDKLDAERNARVVEMHRQNLSYEEGNKRYDTIEGDYQKSKNRFVKAFPISREYEDEKEHIFLGVKWKKGVDSGEWREKSKQRLESIKDEIRDASKKMSQFSRPIYEKIVRIENGGKLPF